MTIHSNIVEPWKVTLVDTGLDTMTGGRLKRIQEYIGNETFMMTYGDGVSDVNINELLAFHKENNKIGTITAIQPEGRKESRRLGRTLKHTDRYSTATAKNKYPETNGYSCLYQ